MAKPDPTIIRTKAWRESRQAVRLFPATYSRLIALMAETGEDATTTVHRALVLMAIVTLPKKTPPKRLRTAKDRPTSVGQTMTAMNRKRRATNPTKRRK